MSLEYLSGLSGPKRKAKKSKPSAEERREVSKQRQAENKSSGKVSKLNPNKRMSPVTKSRVNKLQVQSKIRKAFVKKAEPIKVEEEEIKEEQEKPADFQAEETPSKETQEETQAQAEETQAEEEQAEMGIYFPSNLGKPKIKVPKLKGKLKTAVKKAKQRLKDDKDKPAEKVAHQLAKQALLIPRGAFLAIMLLGKALEKTPIKINLGKKVAEVWSKKNKQLKELWYKVGGEADILEAQINKFKSSKISGNLGVVTAVAAGGSVTAASPIVVKFLKIVGKAKEFAEKNPKLLAQGQALVNKGIKNVAEKNPAQLQNLNLVADEITKVLPADTQAKINKIRTAIPKATTDKNIKNATTGIKTITSTLDESPTATPKTSNKNMLLIGGGAVAILATYLLMKKGKK
jgi:hypothetical protein